MGKNKTAIYMISISSTNGPKGALLVEFDSKPDIKVIRVEAEGPDVTDMGLNKYHTLEEMQKLGYKKGVD